MAYPVNLYQEYHAHIYFDQQRQDLAYEIRRVAEQEKRLIVGNFNQKLVGPHLSWSFSIDFSYLEFEQVVSWLEAVRQDLSVLVHAVTGDDFRDHTEFAYWLGPPAPLNTAIFESH